MEQDLFNSEEKDDTQPVHGGVPAAEEPADTAERFAAEAEEPRAFEPEVFTGREKPSSFRKIDISGIAVTSFGPYLRQVREKNNISVSELAEATKIRTTYIEAVEAEDFDTLPPAVYVLAYIKKLCECFELPAELVDELTSELQRHIQPEAPDDPSKTVVDVELSQENPILFKRIIFFGAAGALLVAILIGLIAFLVFPFDKEPDKSGAVSSFDDAALIAVQPRPELEMHELGQKPSR